MKSLTVRLEKLEQLAKPIAPIAELDLPRLMADIEQALEMPPGSLPRTPEEAAGRGYQSMAAALADTLGLTMPELKAYLTTGEYNPATTGGA